MVTYFYRWRCTFFDVRYGHPMKKYASMVQQPILSVDNKQVLCSNTMHSVRTYRARKRLSVHRGAYIAFYTLGTGSGATKEMSMDHMTDGACENSRTKIPL